MSSECEFFESAVWEQRLTQYVLSAWDVETFLRKSQDEKCGTDQFESFIGKNADLNADTVARMPIGQALEDTRNSLSITEREVYDTWKRHNGDSIPGECPHDQLDSETEFCLFHAAPATVAASGVTPEAVANNVVETITARGEDTNCFVGARFGQLDLSNRALVGPENYSIDFRYTSFKRTATFEETVFGQDVSFKGAVFGTGEQTGTNRQQDYDAQYVDFVGDFDFMRAQFNSKADFKFCTFDGDVRFNSTNFEGVAMFNYAHFVGRSDFMAATFVGKADFSKSRLEEVAYLNAKYETAGIFNYTVFTDDVVLYRTTFDGKAEFFATKFNGDLDGGYATFKGEARFNETTFGGETSFANATFADALYLNDVTVHSIIEFSEAVIRGGVINVPTGAESPVYDFSFASLYAVTFSAPDPIKNTLFRYLLINQTTFEDFNFTDHLQYLKPSWDLYTTAGTGVDNPLEPESHTKESLSALEATYNRAKIGAKEQGHNKAASEFFFKEMNTRRKQYLTRFREISGVKSRLVLLVRWFSNATLGLVSGYGERPSYVITNSAVVIALFSGVYWVFSYPASATGILGSEHLIFSIQSFVTLIFGPTPGDALPVVQFLSALEGLIGAFLIALLVFTLTRSIHR